MKDPLERTGSTVDGGVRLLAILGGLGLLWLMALTVVAVILRKLFNAPIFGVQDLSEATLVVVVFFGMAYCGWTGGHIAVNLIGSVLRGRALGLLDAAMRSVCATFFGFVCWETVLRGLESRELGEATNLIFIPQYPFLYVVAFGTGLYALVLFLLALRSARGLADPPTS